MSGSLYRSAVSSFVRGLHVPFSHTAPKILRSGHWQCKKRISCVIVKEN
jgi:hypothetical protein